LLWIFWCKLRMIIVIIILIIILPFEWYFRHCSSLRKLCQRNRNLSWIQAMHFRDIKNILGLDFIPPPLFFDANCRCKRSERKWGAESIESHEVTNKWGRMQDIWLKYNMILLVALNSGWLR
jgi:hypothetical protein